MSRCKDSRSKMNCYDLSLTLRYNLLYSYFNSKLNQFQYQHLFVPSIMKYIIAEIEAQDIYDLSLHQCEVE